MRLTGPDRRGVRTRGRAAADVLPWLIGLALLAAAIAAAIHWTEAEAFVTLARRAAPGWLLAAVGLQILTYAAQGAIWREVSLAAGFALSIGDALRLSVVKLFADQALPSGGISGTVVVAGALERRTIPPPAARAAVLINLVGYHVAYVVTLAAALAILRWEGHAVLVIVLTSILFGLFAVGLVFGIVMLAGGERANVIRHVRRIAPLRRSLRFVETADSALVRNRRLLTLATTWQTAIVLLDAGTMWTLVHALGAPASVTAIFASFMIASLVRTVGVVPGGLGTFEATSVLTLSLTGTTVAAALAATLLFRGLSFWLPMLPGFWVSRRELARQPARAADTPYWSAPLEQVFATARSKPEGLTADEASARRAIPRGLTRGWGRVAGYWEVLRRQVTNPLMLLLLFAVAASMATGDWLDAVIVLVIIVASAGVTASREVSAHAAAESLRSRLRATARVLRDGRLLDVPADEVVTGDVLALSAGQVVPADGRVLSASHCFVNEAPLTGESFPVMKEPETLAGDTPLHRRSNCVFLGTAVQSGSITVLAVYTGEATELGRLAERLELHPPETEFERGLRHFGYLMMTTMLLMVIGVFVIHVLNGRPATETLLFAVALAVGLSPELLPAILSINLARDAQAMAARGVLVRRLNAIENLGSMDVLCTDKTGTLTEGVVRLYAALDPEGTPDPQVLSLAAQNARLSTGVPGPLDAAILAAAPLEPLPAKLAEIPFEATRRRASVIVVDQDRGGLLMTKGAFDAVADACTHANGQPLNALARQRLQQLYEDYGAQGIRVLGVATRRIDRRDEYGPGDETALDFRGVLTFVDRVKLDAAETLASLRRLGVSTVLITGDNVHVATYVARAVGLSGPVVTGDDLDAVPQLGLSRLAERTAVFAELDPAQKERVVSALRKGGHVVGFLGDGVNDVAAMHAADTSLAVDTAIDVARQAADFVLLERGLDVIKRGIEEGRRTFANTLKYILITMSANLGNMMSMAVISLVLPFLPMLAGQVLLNNFLSDIPAVGLAGDRVDPELVDRPRRLDVMAIGRYMVRFGLLSSLFDMLTFAILLLVFMAGVEEFRTAWFVESLLTELAVALVVRTRRPIHQSRPGSLLLWSTIAVAATALVLPYLPGLALLGFVPLPPSLIGAVVGITAAYVLAAEFAKRRLATI